MNWISTVDERPEFGQKVLVFIFDEAWIVEWSDRYCSGIEFFWMPLPPPPE